MTGIPQEGSSFCNAMYFFVKTPRYRKPIANDDN